MRSGTLILATLLAACSTKSTDTGTDTDTDTTQVPARVSDILALTPDLSAGATLYATNCGPACHLEDGTGNANGGAGTNLTTTLSSLPEEEAVGILIDGVPRTLMSAWGDFFEDQEIADVVAYIYDEFGG